MASGNPRWRNGLAILLEHREMRHVILIADARGLGISDAQLRGEGPRVSTRACCTTRCGWLTLIFLRLGRR